MAAQIRECVICGEEFVAYRSDAKTCSRAHRKHLSRSNQPIVTVDDRLELHVWNARREGVLDFEEALSLLANPSAAVLDRLAVVAA